MKTTAIWFTLLCFYTSGYGQQAEPRFKIDASALPYYASFDEDMEIVSYKVEERVRLRFGSYTTTYRVSSRALIPQTDLGPGNVRIITPQYARRKTSQSAMKLNTAPLAASVSIPVTDVEVPLQAVAVVADVEIVEEKTEAVALISVTDTYERILKKGYKSVDMMKRVANSRFFDGDMEAAATWYSELFAITEDLEDAYFYRYAQALKSTNRHAKAAEVMKDFEARVASSSTASGR